MNYTDSDVQAIVDTITKGNISIKRRIWGIKENKWTDRGESSKRNIWITTEDYKSNWIC